jgi:transcription initiation factor TFIIB
MESIDVICQSCGLVLSSFDLIRTVNRDTELAEEKSKTPEQTWLDYCTVTNSSEERVAISLAVLEEYASGLKLSTDARLRAAELLGEVAKQNLSHGRPTEYVVGGVVYLAAREVGEARPLAVVDALTGGEGGEVKRLARVLQVKLDLKHPGCSPVGYVSFLCSELGFDETVRAEAVEVVEAADEAGLANGRSPTGLAGAALYVASGGAKTQRAVADAANVSKETIRVRIAELRKGGIVDA